MYYSSLYVENCQIICYKIVIDTINLMPIVYSITITAITDQITWFHSGFNFLQGFFML